jgi:alkylation response protein AidB-like acyl-CoA dehydrogenase
VRQASESRPGWPAWSDVQQQLREAIRQLGPALSEGHLERDRTGEFSEAHWGLLARSGLFGLPLEERFGGLGQDLVTTMGVFEVLGESCRDGGLAFSASTHLISTGIPVQRFGSPALQQRVLPRIADGSLIGAHAISEPDSGSDALAMRTRAVRDGDGWVLHGSKTFVSNAPIAGAFVVYARTDASAGPLGITAFLVGRDAPGLQVGRPMDKMGLKTSPMAELFLDGCAVTDADVVGRVGNGFLVLDHVMKWEILCSFAVTLGEMAHRLERCLQQARSRRQFGQAIGAFQAVSHQLVDMQIGLETSRMWLYRAAERFSRREDCTRDIATAKLVTSEENLKSALAAVQLFGGGGYMSEMGLEKDLRQAVGGRIYSGTSEIQRNRIASTMGLP